MSIAHIRKTVIHNLSFRDAFTSERSIRAIRNHGESGTGRMFAIT